LVGFIDDNPDSISPAELESWSDKGIELCGEAADVRPFIKMASVFVLPSYREGTPRTVLEAMAMGRAIITTNAPGCKETVIEGTNGYMVPIKDITTLAEKMVTLADSSDLRIEMGKNSLKIACEKYDVRKVNKMLMAHIGL
jgi:glycosyltransferase involved in cell wall biosynthesis